MAATTEDRIEALMRRVDALEKKLLSSEGALPVIPLTTAVRELERGLEGLAGREKSGGEEARQLWGKVGRLESLVSPEYVQGLKTTESARTELLCTQVEQLKQLTDRIEEVRKHFSSSRYIFLQVHQLKDYINSTECQGLETHERKLAGVAATHLEQEANVADLTRQTHSLMEGYRKLMLQLSAQCIQWDEALAQREIVKT